MLELFENNHLSELQPKLKIIFFSEYKWKKKNTYIYMYIYKQIRMYAYIVLP